MPPTLPLPSLRSCFLYRLFRPEFIRQYHKPLSSGKSCEHRHRVYSALTYSLHRCVQSTLWRSWTKSPRTRASDQIGDGISHELEHSKNSNFDSTTNAWDHEWIWIDALFARSRRQHEVRLYLVHLVSTFSNSLFHRYFAVVRKNTQSAYFKQLLLIEMVARGIKNYIRELLRETKRSKKYENITLHHVLAANYVLLGCCRKNRIEKCWSRCSTSCWEISITQATRSISGTRYTPDSWSISLAFRHTPN